jgi:hypothetical protein
MKETPNPAEMPDFPEAFKPFREVKHIFEAAPF